ncbi:MAG: hypothetical protein GVY08_10410 [Bacteroidetes bacterium]|jgi:hypothetical protein|nr:hypothetical protein [Bacteroidota bacterium]
MEQLVRDLTKKYTDLLPSDLPFYTPEDLRDLEIPEFVIRRIEVEMYRNLNESIVPPHSEWADMMAAEVREAWEQFIEAIVEKVRMPASYAAPMFETAVADIVELLLRPRFAVPAHLFDSEEERSLDEIQKGRDRIVVNGHLADAVIKYMKRKEREAIRVSECRTIVQKVDERLTQRYNSLDWAQFLQPLFVMAGPEVDSEYLRIFFEDRKMNRVSRQFDLLSDTVDKARLIEVLSSPQLLDNQGEEGQSTLFDRNIVTSASAESTKSKDDTSHPAGDSTDDQRPKKDDDTDREQAVHPANAMDHRESNNMPDDAEPAMDEDPGHVESGDPHGWDQEDAVNDPDQEENEHHTFADHFRYDDEAPHTAEYDESGGDEDDTLLYNQFTAPENDAAESNQSMNAAGEATTDDETALSEKFTFEEENSTRKNSSETVTDNSPENDTRTVTEEIEENRPEEEEDVIDAAFLFGEKESDEDEISKLAFDRPIWEAFLQDDDAIGKEDIDELDYSPFADLDEQEQETEGRMSPDEAEPDDRDETGTLSEWLRNDEERFKDVIFSGSVAAYQKALTHLENFDNWRQASTYIEEEIFAQNHVDMYSEPAVEFTDRLQAYFDKFKS